MSSLIKVASMVLVLAVSAILTGCAELKTFSFYDGQTDDDSVKLQNIIAQFVIEHGFKIPFSYIAGESTKAQETLLTNTVIAIHEKTAPSIISDGTLIEKVGNYYVRVDMAQEFPEVMDFLEKMQIDSNDLKDALAFAEDNSTDFRDAALYYFLNSQTKWKTWVPKHIYEAVKKEMSEQIENSELKDFF